MPLSRLKESLCVSRPEGRRGTVSRPLAAASRDASFWEATRALQTSIGDPMEYFLTRLLAWLFGERDRDRRG